MDDFSNNDIAEYLVSRGYKVEKIKLFGVDFSYKGNLHFAESGRASVEFWLSKAMNQGIQVEVAHTSYLLDTAVPTHEKLYGYHRLDDPLVVITDEKGILIEYIFADLNNLSVCSFNLKIAGPLSVS